MKTLFYTAAVIGALGFAATAAYADNHKGKMMAKVDTDGNGVVSKAEFMAKHEEQFAKMDVDGDGNLSKEEMKEAREHRKDKMKEMKDKASSY